MHDNSIAVANVPLEQRSHQQLNTLHKHVLSTKAMATVISFCMFGIFGLFVRYLNLSYFEMTNKYLYNKLNDKNNILGDQGGVKSSTPIDKMESKGAIPKQPNKGKENQMSNRNDCEIPKMTDGIPVEIIVSTDVDRLKSMISKKKLFGHFLTEFFFQSIFRVIFHR